MEKTNEKLNDLWEYIRKHETQIEKALREHLPVAPTKIEPEFNEALEYALFSGGKNVRPILTLLGAGLFGGRVEDILPSAVAVEFVHTSSQIFADLPCMYNADSGRGKVALHLKVGEGLAILVALGLLNASYPLVFVNHIAMPERALQAHREIVECVGASGLVGGQAIDKALAKNVELIDFSIDESKDESPGNLRNSVLMRLAFRVGAILAGADYPDLANVSRFAELLSIIYALSDDLTDFENGSDNSENNQEKDVIQNNLDNLAEEAKSVLVENFPSNEARSCLIQLTEYLVERKA